MSDLVPDGWEKKQLSQVCDVIGGGTPERSNMSYWGGDIPWLSPTEVTSLKTRYISETKESITNIGLHKSSAKLLPAGTLLMTSRASIGYVAINTIPLATNQGFQSLQCHNSMFNEFLYQSITWMRPELERLSAGSTFSEISSKNVKTVKIIVPPLPEQQKIAAILSSVDEVIEKTQAQINKLKDLKTGMMQELLSPREGQATNINNPQGESKNSLHHTEFKDSPLGRIPIGWEVESIEDVLDRIIDYRGKSPPKSEIGVPLITAKNIRQGFINKEPREYIYEEKFEAWMVRGIPRHGDIFITTEAPLGNIARVPKYKFAIGQRVLTLSPKVTVTSDYLFYVMQGTCFKEQLDLQSTGSTVAGIKQSTFRKIKLPIPPIFEQEYITKPLNALNQRIDTVSVKLDHYKNLKKALMQDLLTGKVRVKVEAA